MPEQTVKHDNTASGFLLILIPVAFLAVFVSVAWPFIMGAALLFTGNNLWQSYQLSKLSQQVNPLFNQLIIEKQGSITPLELSVRANISGKVASRYLHSKAIEFGGTSQRSDSQGVVYKFLTFNSLENVFTGINPNPTAIQKLDFEAPSVARLTPESIAIPVIEQPPVEIPSPLVEVATAPPVSAETTTTVELVPETSAELTTEQLIDSTAPETTVELITEPAATDFTETPVKSVIEPLPEPVQTIPVSSFGQALRSVFNAEHTEVEDQEVAVEPEIRSELEREIISQADLAKRLDVHASTIYKRRSDVSFAEWTRNRDPDGLAWGYSRESKEFYQLG